MLIPRLRIKLFGISDKKNFRNTAETAIRDLIKVLVMGYHPSSANRHWLEVISNSILGSGRESFSNRPKLYVFLGVSNEQERRKIGDSIGNFINNPNESSENFIKRLWRDTALQKNKGKIKYQGMMNSNPSSNDITDLLEKIRFIALCLSDQMKPEDFNWDKASLRTQINFDNMNINRLSVSELSEKLKEIILVLCPGISF